MEEIWKDIKGYEGRYQISNKGRVYSLPKSWDLVTHEGSHEGILLKPNLGTNKGLTVDLLKNGIRKKREHS